MLDRDYRKKQDELERTIGNLRGGHMLAPLNEYYTDEEYEFALHTSRCIA